MKRKLLLTAAIWATTVVLMALQKPVFLLYYAAEASQSTFGEWMQVVWHGLKLDMTVAGYITALPILFLLVNLWVSIPDRIGRKILGWYLTLMAVVAAALFAVDLGLYEYWGFRLDSTLLIYLSDPKEAMASVDGWMAVRQTLIWAVYAALMCGVYWRVVRLYDGRSLCWCRALPWSVVMLLVAGLDFLSIRGGVGTSVANVSKVCFSPTPFLNHAAVNPIFSFLSTLGKQENYAEAYPFYDAETLAAQFDALRGNKPVEGEPEQVLTTTRPNVAIILLESFGTTVFEAEEQGEPILAELQRLKGEGVFFDNFYASSFRTDRGQVAVLSGFPGQTKISIMKLTPKCRELPSIARSLGREGYRTRFYYGGDINFTNQASYMYNTGWQELVWQNTMSFDAPTSKWGYDDAVVGEFVADDIIRLSAEGKPFLAGWLTLSSHEPFEVPFKKFDEPRTNAFAFTDHCVGQLVERLKASPAWENLLLILVPDHGCWPFRRGQYTDTDTYQIPMLWLGGAVREPRIVEEYAAQIDLAATLLGQMQIDHSDFDYSKDIFHPAVPKFAYYTYNEGFGILEKEGMSLWDGESKQPSEGASERQLQMGRTLLQQTYMDIANR